MANPKYDFAVDKYFLVRINDEGPSRIEGNTTYGTFTAAKRAAENRLRKGSNGEKITVVRVEGTFWLDPKPDLMSDLPEVALPSGESDR